MKIRNGFVSNSSSSSFIVKADCTMDVFKKMVKVVKDEYLHDSPTDWSDAWYKHHQPKVDYFLKVFPKDYNGGIMIPFTTNFDTYIFPAADGKCYIETCNNHDWDQAFSSIDYYESEDSNNKFNKELFVNIKSFELNTPDAFFDKYLESIKEKSYVELLREELMDCEKELGDENQERNHEFYRGMIDGLELAIRIYEKKTFDGSD